MAGIPSWVSLIPTGVSVLSGLFGGGKPPQNPYQSQIEGALDNANREAGSLSSLGNQANNTFNQFSPQANAAIENYGRYLQQNPYTSAYSTALLNQATNSTTAAYQQAKAQLQSDLASRGMLGSGMEAGAFGTIDASQAQAMASAQNNIAMQAINQYGQNQATLANLYSGAASNAYGQASSNYGNAANIYGNVASQFDQFGNQQEQANMDYQNQQDQALSGLGSGLSSSLAGYFGGQQQNNLMNMIQALIKQKTPAPTGVGSGSNTMGQMNGSNTMGQGIGQLGNP